MLTGTQDNEEIIERVAALDIGKAELVCCVRVPDEDRRGRRLQEVETYSTMTRSLLGLADRLRCLGVTRVVMEATSDYWKPVFYLLEAAGFETWLVNARDVKHLPGRPKTDKLDCIWLCKVAERQMIRPSFVPPLSRRPGRGAHRGEEPSREAAGRRPDQAQRGRHRHLRGLRPGHAGRAGRRGA
jgi:transposase